ncbi:MAG: enoyl-CoA hydratase-related protein [Pseudomonadaceae bacterium]|nr:enoyl-CoA hydratase-related protein [Pseudomonadaceae bacterium]
MFLSSVLSLELDNHVATLWLDRPDKRNAMSRELWGDLQRAMSSIAEDDTIRAVVIAGRGKSFCVGLDLADLNKSDDAPTKPASEAIASLKQLDVTRAFQAAITSVADCPVPVIAAIHSHCIGAGLDLITACDIRITARDAVFSVRETKIGIVADVGTLQRLPGVVNRGQVAELAYTGKDIDAVRAEKIGLVNDVYDSAEDTVAAAQQIAGEIAGNAPLAVRGTKFVLQQSEELTTEQSLLLNALWTMTTSLNSNDLKEAMLAFTQKRPPVFSGS